MQRVCFKTSSELSRLVKPFKLIIAVVLLCVAGFLLQRFFNPQPIAEQAGPPAGLGQVVAEQAAKAISEQGEVLVLDWPGDSVDSQSQRAAFKRQMETYKNIKVSYRDFEKREVSMTGAISFDQFAAEISKHPNAAAVISFLGINSFSDAQIASLPKPCPKLVVSGWHERTVRNGLNKGVIAVAVMCRELTELPTNTPKTPRQWFDRYNYLLTPQGKVDSLAANAQN